MAGLALIFTLLYLSIPTCTSQATCATILFAFDITVMCFRYDYFPLQQVNPDVEVLIVKNNQIPSVPLLDFPRLYHLDASKNSITLIEDGAFAVCKKLKILDLSHNKLKNISLSNFEGLENLNELNLAYNMLTEISDVVIFHENLEELDIFNVSHNYVNYIEHRAIAHLGNLKTLDLSFNQIHTIPSFQFTGLKQLARLDLSNNKIDMLNATAFSDLHYLKILNLESNQISNIDDGAFWGLYRLEELNLNDNQLSTIPEAVGYFHSLTSLSINLNPIRRVGPMIIPRSLETFSLQYCPLLNAIEDNTFLGARKLRELNISKNAGLKTIQQNAFDPIGRNIRNVDLSNNALETLAENLLDWSGTTSLNLEGNSWTCDLKLAWLNGALPRNTSKTLWCSSPRHFAGLTISEVDFDKMLVESANSVPQVGGEPPTNGATVTAEPSINCLARSRYRDPLFIALTGVLIVLLSVIGVHLACRFRKAGVKYKSPTIEESHTYMDEPEKIHVNVSRYYAQ